MFTGIYMAWRFKLAFCKLTGFFVGVMAARQLAGQRPLYFTADVSIFLLYFFRRLISEVSEPIVTKLCHMFGGDCNL